MTRKLRAVYDDDLQTFLASIGILTDLQAGRIPCAFCSETVTSESLHAVFPDSGRIKVSCNQPACIRKLNSSKYNE